MERNQEITYRLATLADSFLFERVAADVFDDEIILNRLHENLADPRHHLAIALRDGTIIGMALGLHYTQPDKAPQFFIDELGVAPEYRRRGVARQLMQMLFDHARSLGCQEAWVATEEDNLPARSLYASLPGSQESRAIIYTFPL